MLTSRLDRRLVAASLAVLLVASAFASTHAQTTPSVDALPPAPGTIPVRTRTSHYTLLAGAVPRLPSSRAVDPALLSGGASSLLGAFPKELWSCTRRRYAAVDPSVAAVLPASLGDACFFEGFETLTISRTADPSGLVRLQGGGYVLASVLQRRSVSTAFHGVLLTQPTLPATVARVGDSVVLDAAAAAQPTTRPITPPSEAFLATVQPAERWVYVDRDHQVLVAYVGRRPVMVTLVSTGRGRFPTHRGEFRIGRKQEVGTMRDHDPARGGRAYHISGIPGIQYFNGGQAFHGAFWHDNFGTRMSHGCVNLSLADAQWLYDFTAPVPPPAPVARGVPPPPPSGSRVLIAGT